MGTILILEDDAVSALVIEEMLGRLGHTARVAARCSDAWSELRGGEIDILILDTELDGEVGWEFLERIRQDAVLSTLPVVVCSGISRRDIVQRYLVLGIQGMIIKPAQEARLSAELAKAGKIAWRDGVLAPAPGMMARNALTADALARVYRRAADEIWDVVGEVSILRSDPFNAPGLARMLALKDLAEEIDSPALARITRDIVKAHSKLDGGVVERALDALPMFVRILRSRAEHLAPAATRAEDRAPEAQ